MASSGDGTGNKSREQPGSASAGAEADLGGSERRRAVRHVLCFPAEVGHGKKDATAALISDLSRTGARLRTQCAFSEGEIVTLQLHVSDELGPRPVRGRVVRVRTLDERDQWGGGVWTHGVAVAFDDPVDDLEAEARELALRQAGMWRASRPPRD